MLTGLDTMPHCLAASLTFTRLGKVAGGTCARRAGLNDSNGFSQVLLPLRMDANFRWVMVNLSLLLDNLDMVRIIVAHRRI